MQFLELIVLAYAVFYAFVAAARLSTRRSATAMAAAILTIGAVIALRHAPPTIRLLAPGLYLVAGYWIPALVVRVPPPAGPTRFERWLQASDDRLRPFLPAVSAPWSAVTEAAYLLCYPIVPVSLALVWRAAGADAVPRFWTTVLIAGLACYGSLPWLLSRPPDRSALRGPRIRAINGHVLGRVSHRWTTFPSGHVAVAWAAALAVGRIWTAAGILLSLIALGVTVGAAAGRYHYVIDVGLGVVVALAAVVIT